MQRGETRVLANVAVLSEGVDLPSVDAIIMATPTRSQVRCAQCVGRGLRPFPGKSDCVVIDVVGVTDRLALQTLPRLFNLRDLPAPEVTVTEALDRHAAADRAQQAAKRKRAEGELRSRPVRMLAPRHRARRLRWLRHRECWLVAIGRAGTLALVPDGERWTVIRLHRDGHEQLAAGVDLGYAHRSAPSWPTPEPDTALLKGGKTGFRFANLERQRPSPPNPAAVRP
ncbi:MAG: helicase-related protein [Solirubrobacteraceae bacterium]